MKNSSKSKPTIPRVLQLAFLAGFLLCCTAFSELSYGPDPQESRKAKISVPPEYPELARRLNIKGIARVQIKVSAGGDVTDVKEVGGNPVFLDALKRAVRKWKYEPSEKESTLDVKFEFVP